MCEIRKAGLDDISRIQEMAQSIFPETYTSIIGKEQVEYMMEMMYSTESLISQMSSQGHIFYICEGAGFVSYHFQQKADDGTSVYHLEKLYVLREFQGTGLGRRLFETVANEIKGDVSGAVRIELNVNRNNPALLFYEHLGMTKDRQGDFPIGHGYYMNDYIMALNLE